MLLAGKVASSAHAPGDVTHRFYMSVMLYIAYRAVADRPFHIRIAAIGRVFNRLAWINPVRAGSLGLDSSKLAKRTTNQFRSVYLDVASGNIIVNRPELVAELR